MMRILVSVTVALMLVAVAVHGAPTSAASAISEASAAGRFLCLIFYETQDASLTALSSSAATYNKTAKRRVTVYSAKLSDPGSLDIVKKYGVRPGDLPFLLVMAPNGVVTGGYPKAVTQDQLGQSIGVSDLVLKVLKPLQEQKVALVALQNQSTKLNAESWQGVNDFVSDANYKQFVTAIKADPSVAGNQEFVKQCQLVTPLSQATVVVLLPPGKIGKIISGKTTKADILLALQSCSAGSCKPGACSDRRFKENIAQLDSALTLVSRLQGVRFTWNRVDYPYRFFPDGRQIGLIAQDVEAVIPEVVATDAEGYRSIAYDKLTAVLIEAAKEMSARIAAQDSLIAALQERVRTLEATR